MNPVCMSPTLESVNPAQAQPQASSKMIGSNNTTASTQNLQADSY
jgi:hypothetical protein